MNEPGRHEAPHDEPSSLTETEDLLVRALSARAEQITHHSLRPGSPPVGSWTARGRGPLVLALAAGVVSVALVGGAAMTLTDRSGKQSDVAVSPTTGVTAPPPLSPSHTPSSPSTGATPVVPPPDEGTTPASRTVTVTYGPARDSFSLRTGGAVRTLTATVNNNVGTTVEAATDILTVTAEGGILRPGDVRVAVQNDDVWKPAGSADGATYTAELASGRLAEDAERTHRVRISLSSDFPAGITGLQISLFSDGGSEALTLS
ncbi:hypothetical protein ABZS61_24695 [Streptomyces sp. NPDC005566]|uniref:hypothetical protein n=1 Tax=Streptomyces sp. NPDC005566 TaxID=3156886 RepID=UPI0033BCAE24